ncbi:Diaminopimelate decarboxylase [Rosistilla carotiformis]|uniref:Diaminopimelate decarboxylase n=1 Tax=Rosistilla carotiformis TaxID=2528017 RepID=A0A518JLA2_9BACT|nr:diaminopimelate decarboxylase [Rosistilla carotiformis]QDV66321.1 Diaminopimelate decarboxylase [Rosistilla carotiformis]
MTITTNFATSRTEIAGHSITDLANQFGTPLYVYDSAVIAQRVADLQMFDDIRYAQKALSNIAILDRLRKQNVLVDAVSAGEIHRALAAGYEPHGEGHPIVYTADIFDREALELVKKHGIHVNCGSPDMIDQLGEVVPGADITLRINPGFGHGHSQKTNTGGPQSKHGIWHGDLDECQRRADRYGITITGLHMHIGSGTDLEHLSKVCDSMRDAALSVGRTITTISAGGGLPVRYKKEETYVDLAAYYKLWNTVREELQTEFDHAVRLEIEPGRYLAAECGYLVTEIRAIKNMGENMFYLVDAGFNDLARPILYGAHHPISICSRSGAEDRPLVNVVVGGPLCESGDIFTQEEGGFVSHRELPRAEVGDLLILENAGAYGFVMASNYNSRLRATELLLEDGQAKVIRSRETFEQLLASETIPS